MISRRDFLRICGAGAAAAALPAFPLSGWQPLTARTFGHTPVRRAAFDGAGVVRMVHPDSVLTLTEARAGWFRTREGYVSARLVQPMLPYRRPPLMAPGDLPAWAEVVAPVTVLRRWPLPDAPVLDRLGYGGVVRVVRVERDDWGTVWYHDALLGGWAQALHLAPVVEDAPGAVPVDHLAIDCRACRLTAFSEGAPVFTAPVSPGGRLPGQARVLTKGPAARGEGGRLVPWVLGLDVMGLGIYGAYWHNDFGLPRDAEAGVAAAPAVARWLYERVAPGQTELRFFGVGG